MSEPQKMSAGHLIVHQLEREGTRRVWLVPGESYLDVLDGLYDSAIEAIPCRQEGGAGFAALAEARLTGQPGVVMVTRGPGVANAMIAVHTAWQDATPLVVLVGLIPVRERGREAFQEFSLEGWFGTTAKHVVTLDQPEDAAFVVSRAWHIARSGRPGPVVIGLPEDVLVESVSAPAPGFPHQLPRSEATAAERKELVALVAGARRPMVVVGGDHWAQRTSDRLVAWASAQGVPVATDFRSYDLVDHDAACFAGPLGYARDQRLADRLDAADTVVYLGCARTDVLSDRYSLAADARSVVISADPEAHGHFGRLDLQLVCDLESGVDALTGTRATAVEPDWMSDAHEDHVAFATPHPDGGRFVDLGAAFGILRKRLEAEPDPVITYGAGNHALWAQRYLPAHRTASLLGPKNGAMGFGIPAAVAAAIVEPQRRVVSVAGDGCLLMNGQELATAHAHGARVLVIAVDNSGFGTIREHQQRHYPGRPSGTSLTNPDLALYARAFGGYGRRVETTEEFSAALDEALAAPGVALLHLIADPAVLEPDVHSIEPADGAATGARGEEA